MTVCRKCDWDDTKKDAPGGRIVPFSECKARVCPMRDYDPAKVQAALPPFPLTIETITARGRPEGSGHVYIIDATGRKVANIWGPTEMKMALANFICDAADGLK